MPLVVLLVAISMEGFSFRTAVQESNKVRGKRSWLRFVRSSKSPELPVILLEDLGALIGLTLALFGVGMMLITGNPIFDVLGSASIGVLLVVIAAFLAVEMKSLLIGESATTAHQSAILEALAAPEGVDRVIHAKTLHLGPDELLVAAKLAVGATDRASESRRRSTRPSDERGMPCPSSRSSCTSSPTSTAAPTLAPLQGRVTPRRHNRLSCPTSLGSMPVDEEEHPGPRR